MRIAVTGGMGFIGTEIVRDLLDRGHEVIVCDYWQGRIVYSEEGRHPILPAIYRNLSRAHAVVEPDELIEKFATLSPAVVIHAGAVVDTTVIDATLFSNNVTYTADLCEIASRSGAHLVFLSSFAVYGHRGYPNNPYGLSKALAEKHVNAMKTRTSCLRLVNVFGSLEDHKGKMASLAFQVSQAYDSGERMDMWWLHAARDFVPVDNVVEIVAAEVERLCGPRDLSGSDWVTWDHHVYDVGTGVSTKLADLDLYVQQAKKEQRSLVREIEMPSRFNGRYQGLTRAGMYGTPVMTGTLSTRQGIEMYYGKR